MQSPHNTIKNIEEPRSPSAASNPDVISDATIDPSPLSSEFLASVSHGPGVYLMLSLKQQVLYVGKARDLRKRLAQYAHYSGASYSKTAVMLSHVQRVETILTTTEKEALILEASLIKQHRPRYNIILRDDKNYPLIKVTTREPWPRVLVTRKRLHDGNRYFGPYSSTTAMRATLQLLNTQFPLRRCKVMHERQRPCLNFQMGRCLAPCAGKVGEIEYRHMVGNILLILEGKATEVINELQSKMETAAAALSFEKAALYRDQIRALNKTLEHQAIVAEHQLDQDIFGIHRQEASVGVAMLFVRNGMITGAQTFFLADALEEDENLLSQVILQYYSAERQPPRELLLPFTIEDQPLVAERLAELHEGPVTLTIPQRGKRMQLMHMAAANAAQIFSEESKKKKSWEALASALQNKLHLTKCPETIECLDISNLQGKQAVGSLVCYVQGEKQAPLFRHYRIKSQDTPNDYAMMFEVLDRRFAKAHNTGQIPDMLMLDGGKGQLQVAIDILSRYDFLEKVDLVAIAKEKNEEGEKLFRPGRKNPILLPSHSPVLMYLMRIRDEAHRFGITFHRKLRGKEQLLSQLDTIRGIGPSRKKRLLQSFGSMKRIMEAGIDELSIVPGIGKEIAQQIFQQIHGSSDEA